MDKLINYFNDTLMCYLTPDTTLTDLGNDTYEFSNDRLELTIIITSYIKNNETLYNILDTIIEDTCDIPRDMKAIDLLKYLNNQLFIATLLIMTNDDIRKHNNTIINDKPPSQA